MNTSSEKFKNKKVISEWKTLSLQHATERSRLGIYERECPGGVRTITGIFQKGGRPSPNVPHFRYFQKGFKSKAGIHKVRPTTSSTVTGIVIMRMMMMMVIVPAIY